MGFGGITGWCILRMFNDLFIIFGEVAGRRGGRAALECISSSVRPGSYRSVTNYAVHQLLNDPTCT